MANLSFLSRLSADVLAEQQVYYGYDAGWGFQILMMLATFLIGFSLAGIFRSVIVEPADMVWPGVLGVTALNKVLHSSNKGDITNGFVIIHPRKPVIITDCFTKQDMEDVAICIFQPGLLYFFCVVLVPGFYHDMPEYLFFSLLD